MINMIVIKRSLYSKAHGITSIPVIQAVRSRCAHRTIDYTLTLVPSPNDQ